MGADGSGDPRSKVTYVRAVRALRGVVAGQGRQLPSAPDPDKRTRHFLRSLLAIYDVEDLVALGVPWWSYRAIDVIDSWLAGRGDAVRAFEYGAGASTIWLADRCAEVHSVEHDTSYAGVISPLVRARGNVDLRVRPALPAGSNAIRSGRAGYQGLDFTAYVSEIDVVGGSFDLIVVDGRARSDALVASVPHLRPGGLVVFDNANRARYRAGIRASGLPVRMLRGLTPALPYPTTTAVLGPR